jgi:hypothetical protein
MMFELDPVLNAWFHAIFDTVRQANLSIKRRPGRRKPTSELKQPRQRVIKEKGLLYDMPDIERDEYWYDDAVIVSRPKEYPHDMEEFEEPHMVNSCIYACVYALEETQYGKRIKFPPAP